MIISIDTHIEFCVADKKMNFEDAKEYAKRKGMRLPNSGEAYFLTMCASACPETLPSDFWWTSTRKNSWSQTIVNRNGTIRIGETWRQFNVVLIEDIKSQHSTK